MVEFSFLKKKKYFEVSCFILCYIFLLFISYFYFFEKCKRFWWESPKERDHLEDQGVGGKMGSEWILGRLAWGVWIGFDWLRTGTGGGLLRVR
jgi:hypothetical protein